MSLLPDQKPNEKVLYVIRRHWFSYLPHLFIALITGILFVGLFITMAYYLSNLSGMTVISMTIFASIAILSVLFILLYGFVDHYLDIFIITDQRIIDIKQGGLFRQEQREVHLLDIENVNAQVTGVFGVLLKFGDIEVLHGGDQENIVIQDLPRAAKVARIIMRLHTKHIDGTPDIAATEDEELEYGFGGFVEELSDDEPEIKTKNKNLSSYWARFKRK